jgi:hypothetical protein
VPDFLAECVNLDLNGISLSLLQHCPRLEKLSLFEGDWTFADFGAGFPRLAHLRRLTLSSLDITDDNNPDGQPDPPAAAEATTPSPARSMWRAVFSAVPKLEYLKVTDCECGTAELVDSLRLLTNLKSLTLTDLPGLSMAITLEAITSVPSLVELVLELTPDPAGTAPGQIVRLCHGRLEHIRLSARLYTNQSTSLQLECPRLRTCELSFDRLDVATVTDSLRARSPLLRRLALGKLLEWPVGVTSQWLCELVADFPLLQSLGVTSRQLPASARDPRADMSLPLTHLSLRVSLSDDGAMRQLLQACPHLRCLDLAVTFPQASLSSALPALPSVTALRLDEVMFPRGARLDLAAITPNAEQVSLASVHVDRLVAVRCHALRNLEMRNCLRMSQVEIADAPRLEKVRFDGPPGQQPQWRLRRCPLVSLVLGNARGASHGPGGWDDYYEFLDDPDDDFDDYYDDYDDYHDDDLDDFPYDEDPDYYSEDEYPDDLEEQDLIDAEIDAQQEEQDLLDAEIDAQQEEQDFLDAQMAARLDEEQDLIDAEIDAQQEEQDFLDAQMAARLDEEQDLIDAEIDAQQEEQDLLDAQIADRLYDDDHYHDSDQD